MGNDVIGSTGINYILEYSTVTSTSAWIYGGDASYISQEITMEIAYG